ncbi:endonuclease/exonuclease/phosphatase family protein [Pontibacter beigongshangensis]|uniref:endonuclease/exonuclease/phosphatase family protein n=1 Tax=Pontibacter beigongshangensis TaxID=2574733 RepID=UPI0016507174|nr:endonuclease/exonuclease/phosphatase family protein [Pontibacter beigongshangensis]
MSGAFKRIRRKFWFILNVGVVLWLLLAVYCLQVPPYEHWQAGFIAFSLPGALVLNFLFFVYWLFQRSWIMLLPLSVMVLGWQYHSRFLALNFGGDEPAGEAKVLEVLSYNVHVFNAYDDRDGSELEASAEMIEWVATHPADVYCLQEFYNNTKGSTVYNTVSRIGQRYDKFRHFSVAYKDRNKAEIGIVIFSKYPIVNKGVIEFGESKHNRAIFADLNMKGDTVRVYSAHLQSMSIKARDIENTYSAIGNQDLMKREGRNLARRLRRGFIARGHQVELLLEHIRESPYPVIVCGDFNDIPFSYTYQVLSKEMANAFEEAGTGVGATYNGPIPFLRIDNQFYSTGLRAFDFRTYPEMGLSDHLPISAKYVLER